MKKLWILLLVTGACSPNISVFTDFDRDINMQPFTTYNWVENLDIEAKNNPLYYNQLNDKRIKNYVDKALTKRGYVLTTEKPDMVLHYHILVENQTELRTDPYGRYGPYWRQSQMDTFEYTEGTFILDFMDAKTNSLAWRGWAISVISSNQEMNEEQLHDAINLILKEYPHTVVKK
jgi:hypothetical protein